MSAPSRRFSRRTVLAHFFMALALGGNAQAQDADASAKPLKLVLGYAPGGALDAYARLLATQISADTNRAVIVENKPGASTRIAIDAVKRANPDGNTVLISPMTPFTVFPLVYKKLGYDADQDLTPLAFLVKFQLVISAGATQPYQTMGEYISWAKANPGQVGFGVVSLGGPAHLGLLAFNAATGLELVPTAYKGAVPMLTDEISGVLPIGIDVVASKLELQKAGKIRFLGVSGHERSPLLPEVPTLKEAGAPGFELAGGWYAAFLPAGTPPDIARPLEAALIKAANSPAVQERMRAVGMQASGQSGAFLRQTIAQERAGWKAVVDRAHFFIE